MNNFQKNKFYKDLNKINGYYSKEIFNFLKKNSNFLFKSYEKWQKGLSFICKELNIPFSEDNDISYFLEKNTLNKTKNKFLTNKSNKIVIGISGPGAVGKGTIKKLLGFNTLISTTTRKKRVLEIQGKDYHFVSEKNFDKLLKKNQFILNTERKNRGKYGVQKKDMDKLLEKNKISIIEENPLNLIILKNYIIKKESYDFIIIYILPPSPIFFNLVARLVNRCKKSGEDFNLVFESTLGQRQLKEFYSLIKIIKNNHPVFFITNDKVEQAVKKIKKLL